MMKTLMKYQEDVLTERIIECIIRVHQVLGPGFLEGIYRKALLIELRKSGLRVECEKEVLVFYDGEEVGCHRLDLIVQGSRIVELKTVEALVRTHYDQLRSYLKAAKIPIGILVNFSGSKADFRRVELG